MTDPERYLRKARESLASAEADVAAGRYNSAANRAYYAAFQAAIAALIHNDIRPAEKGWQHKFVITQFSGKLIRRRKLLSAGLTETLEDLFSIRVIGDYEPHDVSRAQIERSIRNAARFVKEVEKSMKLSTLRESSAEYNAEVAAGNAALNVAEDRINELQDRIKAKYPLAQFAVVRFGPKDYRLNVFLKRAGSTMLHRVLKGRTIDILVDDDIWIVVIPHPLRELRNN